LKSVAIVSALLFLSACALFESANPAPSATAPVPGAASAEDVAARNGKYSAPPAMTLDAEKIYYATFKTEQGDIKVQLYADRTPQTVNNFVFLARDGFYDNTTFHRVLDGFMAQAGDPTGTGAGGPGYTFADEFGEGLVFDRPGLLAMANAGPNTNGSQFFLTFAPTPHLNGRHTIFGEVVEGQDVLDKLTRRDPQQNPTTPGDALYRVVIEESDASALPTSTSLPPTPTPFSPSALDSSIRPMATMTATARSNYFNTPPTQQIIEDKVYTGTIVTNQGVITLELRGDLAPVAVNNFIVLADLGFFDETPVNLVSPQNFIIVGSPGNAPESDAGYALEPEMNLPVTPGAGFLAYVPKTNDPSRASSSQFFLMLGPPAPEMNARYSFFGRVVAGLDVLARLTTNDTVESITVAR
jgi:peptidylprolyl isomerase/peptidyl-prolyl cis-trans isomerase B (cyclophilin B)